MHIVYQKDKRSGITYAYESNSYWDKEKKVSRSKRTLIGRVDKDTGEIVPTDGRNKKHSPYQKVEKTQRDMIMDRIRPMGMSELRKEVIRLELEVSALKAVATADKDAGKS
jgi:DNA modification methylase